MLTVNMEAMKAIDANMLMGKKIADVIPFYFDFAALEFVCRVADKHVLTN